MLHCVSKNKHGSPGASSRPSEALLRGTGTRWGRGEPRCRESVGLPMQGHARDASGISIHGTEEHSSLHPPLQPLRVPATWKISNFIQAPLPLSPCIRSGQSLWYHLLFSASFPLAAAQGNLLAKSCRGRVWCIFLARPWLFLLRLSNPARIVEEATPAALGSCPASMRHRLCLPGRCASVLGAGGECGHCSGAALRAPVLGTSSRDYLSSPALARGTRPGALFALGWVLAVDATSFIPG